MKLIAACVRFLAILGAMDLLSFRGAAANHWAFHPIDHPTPPAVQETQYVHNGIDQFILRQLEAENVSPSPIADRSTLIRRAYLDVIGLPPTPTEQIRWATMPGNTWYTDLIDHLLASPHYGERWGRFWLDQARYADTDGYEKDSPRPNAYRWRDWVIDALNDDLPFDEFTEQQIAGDLLPGASDKTRTATGFNRNTLTNREGGIDKEEDRVKQVVDRINTVATVWMGLTVKCAQCHDHKYDAISHKEYFQLYSFFNNADEQDVNLAPTRDQQSAYNKAKAAHEKSIEETKARLTSIRTEATAGLNAFTTEFLEKHSTSATPTPTNGLLNHFTFDQELTHDVIPQKGTALLKGTEKPTRSSGILGQALTLDGKGQHLSLPHGPTFDATNQFTYSAWIQHNGGIGGIITRMDEDANFKGIDFTSLNGIIEIHLVHNWPDNCIKVTTLDRIEPGEWHHVLMTYDGSRKAGGVQVYIDGTKQKLRTHYDSLSATFRINEPTRIGSRKRGSFFNGSIDDVRIYNRVLKQSEVSALGKENQLQGLVNTARTVPAKRTPEQTNALLEYSLSLHPEIPDLRKRLRELEKSSPKVAHGVAMSLQERKSPRRTYIHNRGDFLKKGEEVHPNVPAFLHPMKPRGDRPDRLDFARWILSDDNPLTARVTVNRVWQQYFGRGIVESSDDFGSEGSSPTHPSLLDWLATEFIKNNWGLKSLHKLILTSRTYMQSSRKRPELNQRDPYNLLLSHQNRLRVEAETVRDLALASSGLLNHRVKGPSVYPPLPAGIIELAFIDVINRHPWKVSEGPDRYRRGLYTFFQRTSPYPMLTLFDAPDSNTACTRREQSNTPLQALTLWNDPVFMECAVALAQRIVEETPNKSVEEQLAHGLLLTLNRTATEGEIEDLKRLYELSLETYRSNPELTRSLLGETPDESTRSHAELAAWISVARTLINLDEFITRG